MSGRGTGPARQPQARCVGAARCPVSGFPCRSPQHSSALATPPGALCGSALAAALSPYVCEECACRVGTPNSANSSRSRGSRSWQFCDAAEAVRTTKIWISDQRCARSENGAGSGGPRGAPHAQERPQSLSFRLRTPLFPLRPHRPSRPVAAHLDCYLPSSRPLDRGRHFKSVWRLVVVVAAAYGCSRSVDSHRSRVVLV